MNDSARIIHVRVTPCAKREYIREGKSGHFDISVKEDAEQGRANGRMRELVAQYLKAPTRNVVIIKGSKTSSKMVRIYANKY